MDPARLTAPTGGVEPINVHEQKVGKRGSKIHATVTIVVSSERREQALEVLRSLMGPIRATDGCRGCRSCADLEDPSLITFESLWATRADLTRHIRSSEYRRILALMELSSESPEVRFSTTSETAGMDLIEDIRGPDLAEEL